MKRFTKQIHWGICFAFFILPVLTVIALCVWLAVSMK